MNPANVAEIAVQIMEGTIRLRMECLPIAADRWRLIDMLEALLRAEKKNYPAPITENHK